jgi:cell division protein FtsZ
LPLRAGVSFASIPGSFASTPAPAPVAAPRVVPVMAPVPAPEPVVETPVVAEMVAEPVIEESFPDELALDDMVEDEVADAEPVAANVMPLRADVPIEAPSPMDARTPVADADESRPMTLFERMMNLNRPKAKEEAAPVAAAPQPDASEDPLEIPRFFKRQVND